MGEVKNSIRKGEAKELICMTHGHELRWGEGNAVGFGGARNSWGKGEKKLGEL